MNHTHAFPLHRHHGAARGLSLTEVLVALTITLIFMGSVTTAYIQISQASEESQNQIQAHATARNAIEAISRDVVRIQRDPALFLNQYFQLESQTLAYGDGLDNDADGRIDEEEFNGFDEDADWTLTEDRHATIGTFQERPDYVGLPDYGDRLVDEDTLFSRDRLSFRIPADIFTLRPAQIITYEVGTFDGEENVLLRQVIEDPDGPSPTRSVEPLVFEVVSFDVLAMNANDDVVAPGGLIRPYWQQEYDAANYSLGSGLPIGTPARALLFPYEFPSSVLLRVVVNASGAPLNEVPGGWPTAPGTLKTAEISTVVALDAVLNDPTYDVLVRPFF